TTVSGRSLSGSVSLPSRSTTTGTSGAADCMSSLATGGGFTGSIVIVPSNVPPCPSDTVTGITIGPSLSGGGVTVSSPVTGSKLAVTPGGSPVRSGTIVSVSPVFGSLK